MAQTYAIHRSKAQVIAAFVAISAILGFFGYGFHAKGPSFFDNVVIVIVAAVVALVWVRVVFMLVTLGKPLAVLNRAGLVLPDGQSIPWSDIRDISLNSIGAIVDFRTDLTFRLTKGKKKLTYVALNEKRLDALLAATRG